MNNHHDTHNQTSICINCAVNLVYKFHRYLTPHPAGRLLSSAPPSPFPSYARAAMS